MNFPSIIQGGMGVAVSDWRLARSVSTRGQIGVVSGTALDLVLARRLQLGDPGGHMRRALATFPDQSISNEIIDRYFIDGGKPPDKPFKGKSMVGQKPTRHVQQLIVAGNFVEVFLAKEGHDGIVGINYLHKIQVPIPASLYGAMLAGADIVIVGAGIPLDIPGLLNSLSRSEAVDMKLYVRGANKGSEHTVSFDPRTVFDEPPSSLPRPRFFPIVSSAALAGILVKKSGGLVDGLIIEAPSAGGHNAPPRGKAKLTADGEPVYGPRDEIDLAAIKSLGVPFWLAGSYGNAEKLGDALEAGAVGIQVGTLFAFCEESGLLENFKHEVITACRNGTPRVFTDPLASPSGFPFKVLSIANTLSDSEEYAKRSRKCDLGYLREAYERPDGKVGWRCAAEDQDDYVRKGGAVEETVGRKCLCNSLAANIDLGQVRDGEAELPLLTCGDDLAGILNVLSAGETSYTSSDVIDYLLSATAAEATH